MLECLKVLPKFIQCQRTGSALVPTHFLYVYSFPRNSEFSAGKVFSANTKHFGGNWSQELSLGASERSHTLLPTLGSSGRTPASPAGHWQGQANLPSAVSKQIFKSQIVPAAAPTSFACYPAESETCAACRESSLFTEETHSCTCQGSINGHLWDDRGSSVLIKS